MHELDFDRYIYKFRGLYLPALLGNFLNRLDQVLPFLATGSDISLLLAGGMKEMLGSMFRFVVGEEEEVKMK